MNDILKLSCIPNEIEVVVEVAHDKENDVLVLPVNLAIVFLSTFNMCIRSFGRFTLLESLFGLLL